MKIINYKSSEVKTYSGHESKGITGRVVIGQADGAKNFTMRVFEVAPGGYTSLDSHPWEHEVFVYSGRGIVCDKEKSTSVSTGSVVFIPGGEQHQLKNIGNEPFVFVCLIPAGIPEI